MKRDGRTIQSHINDAMVDKIAGRESQYNWVEIK